ncbi:MAG: vWA domain-containing protein [Treponema sp.]
MINFLYPHYLLFCFLVIPCSFFYLIRINKLVKIIGKKTKAKSYIIKLKIRTLLFSLAWICLCISLASPIYGTKIVSIQKRGASIIFVMDISNSMMIKDNDVSRLSMSKYLADFIVQKYSQHAFGLVLAKGEGILSVPLTFEHGIILENINSLSPLRLTSIGTNLELGLLKAINSFNNERSNSKIIVLFTDGDETHGKLLDVANVISESKITLIVVGVGTKEGGNIKVLDNKGETIEKHSELKEELLIEMAKLSDNDSIYINSNSFLSLKKMFSILDNYNSNTEKIIFKKEPKNISAELSLFSLIFFCIGVIICYETKIL